MRTRIVNDMTGKPFMAYVTLSKLEREIVLGYGVPAFYGPGGMGPDRPEKSATVRFGGACGVPHLYLADTLDNFRNALVEEIGRRKESRKLTSQLTREARAEKQREEDYKAGWLAFPAGQFMDAMRGTKRYPMDVRCPFSRPERAAAWRDGYAAAHASMFDDEEHDAQFDS